MNRILLCDPDPILGEELRVALERKGNWILNAGDGTTALELLQKQYFHACIWPLSNDKEIQEIHAIKRLQPMTSVILSSPTDTPAFIVACMRAGASHFWCRSSGVDHLIAIVDETLARISSVAADPCNLTFPFPQFVGRHPKILEVFQLIMSIRNTDSTVLITGESGTGKEIVARAIHSLSPRTKHPWVAVNCGAIPASLLESELFGHVRGAFTGATQNRTGRFQLAGAGTLFLDEISDLPFDLQAKILRAIHNRVYESVGSSTSNTLDARIIAATNQDLQTAVTEKRFRQDLYYRLNVIPIYIPPLRARKSDIPLLVRFFIDRFSQINNRRFSGISEDAMQCLMHYHWPGNIRELENLMERVIVLKQDDGIIELKDLPAQQFSQIHIDRFLANVALPEEGLDFYEAVNEFENELIIQALQRTAGNKNQAATLLNLNRTTLVEKLKRKGLRLAA